MKFYGDKETKAFTRFIVFLLIALIAFSVIGAINTANSREITPAKPVDFESIEPVVFEAYFAAWPINHLIITLLDAEDFTVTSVTCTSTQYGDINSIAFSYDGQDLNCTVTEPGDYFITIEATSSITGKVVYLDTIAIFG